MWLNFSPSLGAFILLQLLTMTLASSNGNSRDINLGTLDDSNIFSGSHTLAKFKYDSLPVGAIKPTGWLQDQLVLSANGLAGHEFDFYRYVARSTWLGGTHEYSELHESAPYWFNYIVPLAWTLDDARLKEQAKTFLDYVLDHQAEDGWLGPEATRETRGIWARSLLLFGLTVCDPRQFFLWQYK